MRERRAIPGWVRTIGAGRGLFTLAMVGALLALAPSARAADFLVTSLNTDQVLRYDGTTGAPVGAFVSAGSGGLDQPRGLAFGPDGNLYVAKSTQAGASAILRYDGTTGAFIDTFVAPTVGGLDVPHTILFGPDGHLYVANQTTNSVLRFNGTTGAFLGPFAFPGGDGFTFVRGGLVFGPDGHLYVSQLNQSLVLRYHGTTGALIGVFVSAGSGGLFLPRGLRFGPDGNLYVASSGTGTGDVPAAPPGNATPNAILRYDGTTGQFMGAFVPRGSGGLNAPYDLVFGSDGHLYVTSKGTNAVLRYDGTTGQFIDAFVPSGSGGLASPIELRFVDRPPVANAGADQTVPEGALVTLDGRASRDPDGQALGFAWAQTGGPAVNLGGATTATPSFVAPEIAGDAPVVLTFQLLVSDGVRLSPADTVQVTVTGTVRLLRPLADGLGGAPPDGAALNPSVSADGRFVAFESTSTNLVPSGCTTGVSHVFVRDRATQTLVCISVAASGAPGDGPSTRPAISADGRFVVFVSTARNLVAVGCRAGIAYVFVRDLVTQTTTCVSVATGGAAADAPSSAPAISGDGRLVVFVSLATNLGGCPGGSAQIYLRDRTAGTTTCVSVGVGGLQGNGSSGEPTISADGRTVGWESAAANLGCPGGPVVHIVIRVLLAAIPACASVASDGTPGNADARAPALNADGSVHAFASPATNLADPCTTGVQEIFVRKLLSGETQCISLGPDGSPGNRASGDPAISADGRTVVFNSQATNLAGPGVLAAALGGPLPQLPPGTASTLRWRDSAAVQDNVTALVNGSGATGDRATAMSADGSIVVTEVQGSGARPALAAIEEVPAPPVGQPLIVAPAPNTAFTLLGAIPLTFQWTAVTNAAGYRLAFTGPVSVALDIGATPAFTVTLSPGLAPPGSYQLQVIPLGAAGAPGTPSAPLAFSLIPGIALQASDRPFFSTPDAEVTVARGQSLTFAWTALAGVTSHGVEFTGTDRVFQNPNGTAPDAVNGFGGAGGGFLVVGTGVTVVVPDVAPGRYQVRVIGLSATGAVVGSFSDAVTVVVQ